MRDSFELPDLQLSSNLLRRQQVPYYHLLARTTVCTPLYTTRSSNAPKMKGAKLDPDNKMLIAATDRKGAF